MNAELSWFAQRKMEPLRLEQIIQASSPRKVANLVCSELPYYFARRVKHIEALQGWRSQPELCKLREIFMESFQELRLTEPLGKGRLSLDDLAEFTKVILVIRRRHKAVPALLGEALRKLHLEDVEDVAKVNALQGWADTFLVHRISTEMLTSHYVAVIEGARGDQSESSSKVGIVDTKCHPSKICEEAAAQVMASFPDVVIHVQANNCTETQNEIEFSYIPRYLFHVVQELLQNSARASSEARKANPDSVGGPPHVIVTVCADRQQVAIRISDEGGGVPFTVHKKIWSYFFSTADQAFEDYAYTDSPLSGWGMGLPLGRLYALYLGGSLELMNMPGIGVDAYLFLNRIDVNAISSVYEPGDADLL